MASDERTQAIRLTCGVDCVMEYTRCTTRCINGQSCLQLEVKSDITVYNSAYGFLCFRQRCLVELILMGRISATEEPIG